MHYRHGDLLALQVPLIRPWGMTRLFPKTHNTNTRRKRTVRRSVRKLPCYKLAKGFQLQLGADSIFPHGVRTRPGPHLAYRRFPQQ